MGDANQADFLRRHAEGLCGPYLEVGSKDYGSTQDLRSFLARGAPYIGADMAPGPGVDVVVDFIEPFERVDAALAGERFGTIVCLSVLEHCRQPFAMAENLSRLLAPGGKLCLSVPFAWQFHGYPSDYWRFTHEGIKVLFPRLRFDTTASAAASSLPGDVRALDEELGKIPFGTKAHWRQGRVLRGLAAKSLALLASLGPLRWLAGHHYVLAPTNVFMIGVLES